MDLTAYHSINDVKEILSMDKTIELSAKAKDLIGKCHAYLLKKIDHAEVPIYGVNTGFGSLCNTQIAPEDLNQLQINLIRSHACGMGDYVPKDIIKLMLLLKAKSLSQGHSGVQVGTIQKLLDLYNSNTLPVVYELGSLGASGDLAPLSHLCLPLIGEGKVWSSNQNEITLF